MSLRTALRKFVDEVRSPDVAEYRDAGSLENPATPLSMAGFLGMMSDGPTSSGETITVNVSLQQITVYACVRVLCTSVSSLPLHVYEFSGQDRKRVDDHPIAYLLRWEPNDEMTAVTFMESLIGSMALCGNSYSQIQRDGTGRAVALWPLHPQQTEPKRIGNDLVYETSDGMGNGRVRRIPSEDVLHIPLFSFNGIKGLSPIQLARQGIALARAAERFGGTFFGRGARPSGVLSSAGTLTDKQKAETKEAWNLANGGGNQNGVAVLPGNWQYHQLSISPEDSQFLETRQFQRSEISQGLFGVPPNMIGDTTRLSNNNHEQMSLQFVTDTLRPYLTRIEAEVMRKLFPKLGSNAGRYIVEFDVSERLRGDFKTTMDGYAVGKQWGFFNTNDVRRELGKNPIGPEGDIYWSPVNMQNAALLLKTESIQDQPVGSDPEAPADSGDDPQPTPAERKLLGRFTRGYIPVFCDAFTRLLKRDRRDYESISALLRPVFRSIADASMEMNGAADPAEDALLDDVVRAMERRAARWPVNPADAEAADLAQGEFLKILRSIHINVSRSVAATRAAQQLALPEGQ